MKKFANFGTKFQSFNSQKIHTQKHTSKDALICIMKCKRRGGEKRLWKFRVSVIDTLFQPIIVMLNKGKMIVSALATTVDIYSHAPSNNLVACHTQHLILCQTEYDVLNVYEFFVYYIFDRVDSQLRMIRYFNGV